MFFDKLNISESKMLKPQTSKKISINKKLTISNSSKCLIVAEISANHGGSLKILKKTILKAKEIGADAVKIQTYEVSTMTLNCKNEISLLMTILYGKVNIYLIYTKKLKHHLNGTRKFLILQRKIKFYFFSSI